MDRARQSAVSKTLTSKSAVPVEAVMLDPLLNPEGVFETPSALLLDRGLTNAKKVQALENWEQLVRQRLSATDEGMDANGTSTTDLRLLERIEHARGQVEGGNQPITEGAKHAATSPKPRQQDREEATVLDTTEARQGSGKLTNFRVLENSLLIAVFVGVALLIAFYVA